MNHDQAARERRRLGTVQDGGSELKPLAEAANYHLAQGGFIDWARHALRSGDPVRELSEAYAVLFERVTNVREQQSQHFAKLLRDWTAVGSSAEGLVPIEDVLASSPEFVGEFW